MAIVRSYFNLPATALFVLLLAQAPWTTSAWASDPAIGLELADARISNHKQTGKVRFIGTDPGRPALLDQPPKSMEVQDFGLAFANQFGEDFGIKAAAEELLLTSSKQRQGGGNTLRYQQVHQGVPIFAGEMIINLNADNALLSMNGEIAADLTLSVIPTLTSSEALDIAVGAVSKWYGLSVPELKAGKPLLSIYDARLLKPSALEPSLVWRIEVSPKQTAPIREMVLIDAHTGSINLHFNQVHMAKNRATYDALDTDVKPGVIVCEETDTFPDCALADTDVINAHDYAGDTYDFYATTHGRDAIDDAGGVITSSVHWNDGVSCPNAFWDGSQMVFCDGLADADDVVAHELTHGVTQNTSNLFYYYQSGAINESLSDVWGEFVDLTNGKGDDSPDSRWLMGEDLSDFGGAIRDMQDPTVFGDPDRMSSAFYWTNSSDNGGVHINSGVNNKAAYLMVDGDSFNGFTVASLGIDKTAKVYYEAQTNLLTSGSDFADLHEALFQGCLNIIGTDGIAYGDCLTVRNATDAVEMDMDPAQDPAFSPDPPMCPYSFKPGTVLYTTDLEGDVTEWSAVDLSGNDNNWGLLSQYSTSGIRSFYAPNLDEVADSAIWTNTPVLLTTDVYLHFRHSFSFETGGAANYDGGVVEYSTDDTIWTDLGSLFDAGQDYGAGALETGFGNPLSGRNAFVSESHGYVASRYNLASLAGENFQVRFRLGSDESFAGPLGWAIDDVSLYQCVVDFDASCSGDDVLIQSREFTGVTKCVGNFSLAADTAVIVRAGAAVIFEAPGVALNQGFAVETGSTFSVIASP